MVVDSSHLYIVEVKGKISTPDPEELCTPYQTHHHNDRGGTNEIKAQT